MKQLSQYFLMLSLLLASNQLFAQISINSENTDPDPSAMLDVQSTTSGFLTPRMTQAQRDAIADPATSLLIYQTDNDPGYYYNNGTPDTPDWVRIGNGERQITCDLRIPLDSVAHFDTHSGRLTAYLITQPGSYYLTDSILVNANDVTAIFIDTSHVTLDLNGYIITGPGPVNANVSSNAIFIQGARNNITIKNGIIDNWGGDGIGGAEVNMSLLRNLIVSNSVRSGFRLGSNNVVEGCHAFGNSGIGFRSSDGCNYIRCTASENALDGFRVFGGTQFINCTALLNTQDGIDGANNVMALGCVVSYNGEEGIELTANGLVFKCTAHENQGSGIDVSTNSRVSFCNASLNDFDGIRLRGESGIVSDCVAHENDENGIHASSTNANKVVIENNGATDNDVNGIRTAGAGVLVIRNRLAGNLAAFDLHPGTNHGPIIDVTSVGDISTVAGANHPLANYTY
ncbi:MAG: right-handed parallel beta-helix repeat-containing protein [Bacteroidota bacterium]